MPKLNDGVTEAEMSITKDEFEEKLHGVTSVDEMKELIKEAIVPKYAPQTGEFRDKVKEIAHRFLDEPEEKFLNEADSLDKDDLDMRTMFFKCVATLYQDELSQWLQDETTHRQQASKHPTQ